MENNATIELIQKARQHDADAFTELIQRSMQDLYRTASAILRNDEDAADAIQDTILICWQKLHTLRQPRYFRTWLTRILINRCYDLLKQRARYTQLPEYEEPAACDEYNLEWNEAMSLLDDKTRPVMVLHYAQGYTAAEIGQFLHLPQATVQSRLRRGREKLARYYNIGPDGKKEDRT